MPLSSDEETNKRFPLWPEVSHSPSGGRHTGTVPLSEDPQRKYFPVVFKGRLAIDFPSDPHLLIVSQGVFVGLGASLTQDLFQIVIK